MVLKNDLEKFQVSLKMSAPTDVIQSLKNKILHNLNGSVSNL